jgi:SAM-dependent methyltransferase
VLDLGCGRGDLLKEITASLGVEGIGIDFAPPSRGDIAILKADATRDLLPSGDVAYSAYVAHHVSDENLVRMIHNVGRSCRRFILVDVVRHWIPLALFRLFVAPFVSRITAEDGRISFRRAYAPSELKNVLKRALAGTGACYRHSVSVLGIRQVVDISYF